MRRRWSAVLVIVVAAAALVTGAVLALRSPRPGTATPAAAGSSPRPAPSPAPASPFGSALPGGRGTLLAAVYDVRTGREWDLGTGRPQAEASVVKLDILQTLLARSHAALPDAELSVARRMMENSDNDAATSLWNASGGPDGIASYNAAAGLLDTTPSACLRCAGFAWPGWGLTTTTPDDQITLLRQLIAPSSRLSADQRRYVLGLMENVTPAQRWGVSAGVPSGVTVALKNGWLPLDAAGDDWQINSVGWISGAGRDYLIAVLTTGNSSEADGIARIEKLSSAVWRNMAR